MLHDIGMFSNDTDYRPAPPSQIDTDLLQQCTEIVEAQMGLSGVLSTGVYFRALTFILERYLRHAEREL